MKSFASILALLALSAVATAGQDMNSASARRDFTCETSSSSPLLSDVQRVYDRLISRGQQKCSVASGSSCTQIQTSGTAAVDVCGPSGWYTDCYNAGRYVRQLADTCKVDMDGTTKVGGIYRYGDGKGYLTVYHT